MQQATLAMANGFERYSRQTRRSEFLTAMEQVVPWPELCALIEPFYPKSGNGRPWSGCCAFIFSSIGSACRIRAWKKRCTIRWRCGVS